MNASDCYEKLHKDELKKICTSLKMKVISSDTKEKLIKKLVKEDIEDVVQKITSTQLSTIFEKLQLDKNGSVKEKRQRLIDMIEGTSSQKSSAKKSSAKKSSAKKSSTKNTIPPMPKKTTVPKKNRTTPLHLPNGYSIDEFEYKGRAATDQDDFGESVGIVDMVHVDIYGEQTSKEYAPDGANKYYHLGVVQSKDDQSWWVYIEWGTAFFSDPSWVDGMFRQEQDFEECKFQFVSCDDEDDARSWFQAQARSKNKDRIYKSNGVWTSFPDVDGYIVQDLAARNRGLPHAHTFFKDIKKTKPRKSRGTQNTNFHPQVLRLAQDLANGTKNHTQTLIQNSGGIIPSIRTLNQVQNVLLPEVLGILQDIPTTKTGMPSKTHSKYAELVKLSQSIASQIPRDIPRHSTQQEREESILITKDNVQELENDIDAFRATLQQGDIFNLKSFSNINPETLFRSDIQWIDPKSTKGSWLLATFKNLSRHSYTPTVKNMFSVSRPREDKFFEEMVEKIAAKRKKSALKNVAENQPKQRKDGIDYPKSANVFIGIHGTRASNVQPILASNLRLPTQLPGNLISGALYGQGIYFATDWRKSNSYCSPLQNSNINYIFLCDVVMGVPYLTSNFGSWMTSPSSTDSVAALTKNTGRGDDEHIIFNPHQQCIRYIIEFEP